MFNKNIVGIRHVCQEQRVAGHGHSCGATVFLLDDFTELLDGEHATSHIEEGADNGTHHVAEETVGGDGELPLERGNLFPFGVCDLAVVRLHVGVEFGKGGEVCVVEESLSRLIHQVEVEGLREAVGIVLEG